MIVGINRNAMSIAVITAAALFLIILGIMLVMYRNSATKRKSTRMKGYKNTWLFHDFYIKVYNAFFTGKDPDELGVKMGIKVEEYYSNCRIAGTVPDVRRLIVYYIYGIILMTVFVLLGVFTNYSLSLIGFLLFIYFVYYEQMRTKSKADAARAEMAADLPRFLDILQSELQVGLPIEIAIQTITTRMDTLLSRELQRAITDSDMGASGWAEAMEQLAAKYDIETLSDFVSDTVTSYRKGISVADSVSRKTRDIRNTHLLNAKESATKKTNTMLLPIMIFQFLPMIIFVMIPVFMQLQEF